MCPGRLLTPVLLATGSWLASSTFATAAWSGIEADAANNGEGVALLQSEVSRSAPSSLKGCSDLCIPAVFVAGTGRSGSTTILHMLNLIPGYDLKGENNNMWGSLFTTYEERMKAYDKYGPVDVYSWHRSPERDMSGFLCGLQTLAVGELNPDMDARVVGFKEIRWAFDKDLADLGLLMQAFPCSKVVLNFRRDIESQIGSMSSTSGSFEDQLLRHETKEMLKFHVRHRDLNRTFLLPLEHFTVDRFNELLRFLGEDDHCHYVDVLHDNEAGGFWNGGGYTRGDADVSDGVITCVSH
eukprot:gb/GFBE01079784.1/.p1 GENE.gb/GFBE01079784.1/~~gb/GFBE01079784.1/.p1  ORF type:complete len:297 (+),score=54.81 gb/GFBE01079784.1/:1-891(+)